MGLTVQELRAQLAHLPDEWLVVLAKDREGNGFSPLDQLTGGTYREEARWAGTFAGQPLRAQTAEAEGAVCLWPTN